MDEKTVDNIRYKVELRKLIGDEISSNNIVNSEIRSDPWIDDLVFLSSTPDPELQEVKVDNDISYSVLYSKDTDESKLMEENIDLYNDLVKIEEEERKAKQIREAEFENCKKELEKLREADNRNRRRIEELNKDNTNLKMSISSLYRTVKNEIEFKDKSLADANSEIIRLNNLLHCKNGQFLKNEKCANCENNSSDSKKDNHTSKRKRSESPEPSRKKDFKSNISKTHEKDLPASEKDKRKSAKRPEHEVTKDKHRSDIPNNKEKKYSFCKEISKDKKHDKEVQTSNQCIFCQTYQISNTTENSRDSRETNDMFFSLLPDSLKKSFYDYERDQMISLNRLKQKFIDEYFNLTSDVPSPILESTPKRQDAHTEQLTTSKNSETRSSPNITSTPTSSRSSTSSEHSKRDEYTKRSKKKELDRNANETKSDCVQKSDSRLTKNYISSSNKKDLVSLFMYRKEKIPFVEKKKFGLDKNGEKIIPEKLL